MKECLKKLTATVFAFGSTFAGQVAVADTDDTGQKIYRAAEHKTFEGPSDIFTGNVHVEMLFPSNDTARYSGAYVTFQPGARSAWHLHPAGQHIVVTEGVGLTGTWDGEVTEIHVGDAIWCPPGVKHWHGATPDTAMTHLVVTASLDGKNVEWKEKVSDEQYNAK